MEKEITVVERVEELAIVSGTAFEFEVQELTKLSEKSKNTILHREVMDSIIHIEKLIAMCTCKEFTGRRKTDEAIKEGEGSG